MARERRSDRFVEMEERFAGYEVYDRDGDKVGKVDDLFLNERDEPEYVGVKMGFLGTKSTLIPMDSVSADDDQQRLVVSAEKEEVKQAPAFDNDQDITPEFEREVRQHYGLGDVEGSEGRGTYGSYYDDDDDYDRDDDVVVDRTDDDDVGRTEGRRDDDIDRGDDDLDRRDDDLDRGERRDDDDRPGIAMGDTESGEFREHDEADEGVRQRGSSDLEDEDELRVQRSEEELVAGTREREAGSVNVRKRVRTEREQLRVPKKREEVKVDRVPVEEGRASEDEIGEDEVRMPVTEEEVVVSKRPEVKEEVRIRKEVEEDEEVVEEDVRKEEIEVDDDTENR